MSTDDEREELVRLVTFLMSADYTEEEQDAALEELEARVVHPRVPSLIFWPSQEGLDRELTPERGCGRRPGVPANRTLNVRS